jgi:chorismate mutase/prephenate dehydratase
MDLYECRCAIDRVDRQIIKALAKRKELALIAGKLKKARGDPVCVPEREKLLFSRVDGWAHQYHLDRQYVIDVFSLLLNYSKHVQQNVPE